MLILYSNVNKINHLQKICKIYKLKNYSKINKAKLIYFINCYKSASYIQMVFRNKHMVSDVCPITLETLEYPFISLKNEKIFRYYSLEGLIGYYNSSRDFRDPITKKEITNKKIQEINTIAKFYKKKQINRRRTISVVRRTELLTILCCLNDIVNNIMSTSEINTEYIENYAIPQIMTYVYYLLIRCRQQSRGVIQHFIDILERHNDLNKYHIINFLVGVMINEAI